MSQVDPLLQLLDRVKRTGPGTWTARCPAHADRSPSLSIRELDDARVMLHCHAGCDVQEVLAAVDLTFDALYPPRALDHQTRPERRPFPAADVLRAIGFEALVVCSAAAALLSGEPFNEGDRERLTLAAGRIQAAMTAAGVTHHG
ncbi:DNA primase [Accumulibacter sp.]|uniref:DNA primase n=1 Tax=Accumulibacter sp. TaxID=2053492 RepID=UPI0025B9604F|nr:DNA primase [Accumulibacter sp.]